MSPSASNPRVTSKTANQPPAPLASHVADRLLEAIDCKGAPVCVGLDPDAERLPPQLRPRDREVATVVASFEEFCIGVLDAIVDEVPCVKPQSACFERYGSAGVAVLERVIAAARARGLQVILDAKRGDMRSTAEHYAAAAFGEPDSGASLNSNNDRPDWLTVNSYLGPDGIEPFLKKGHGAFALVRTSNPSGDAVQSLPVSGAAGSARTVAEAVAVMVAEVGRLRVGKLGYSSLGAVVGATKPHDAVRLRELMPQQLFLVPGFGAQGAGVDDVLPCFHQRGRGAIVSASRSVLYAFAPGAADWRGAVRDAARRLADEIGAAVGTR